MDRAMRLPPAAVGVGWRQPHYREVMTHGAPGVDFLEVHAENFLAPGGAARTLLRDASERFPLSLHGVSLGLGSACGMDLDHLRRLRALVDEVNPVLLSEHACFTRARHQGQVLQAHDLLPIPFTEVMLRVLVDQVDQAQEVLGRKLLIENLSAYVGWANDDIPQPLFFNALARATGCGLLLDLNNLFVNALNEGPEPDDARALRQASDWVDAISPAHIGEIHLAGHARLEDLVIDDHGSRVADPVWRLYEHACRHIGPRPTLIEWDTDVPALSVLTDEAAHARRLNGCQERSHAE